MGNLRKTWFLVTTYCWCATCYYLENPSVQICFLKVNWYVRRAGRCFTWFSCLDMSQLLMCVQTEPVSLIEYDLPSISFKQVCLKSDLFNRFSLGISFWKTAKRKLFGKAVRFLSSSWRYCLCCQITRALASFSDPWPYWGGKTQRGTFDYWRWIICRFTRCMHSYTCRKPL